MKLLLIFILLTDVAAGWLIWRGWRGKKVDEHPVCVKCGYDLVGLLDNEGKWLGGRQCPECGKGICLGDTKYGVKIGNRERKKWKIVSGGMVAIVNLAVVAMLALPYIAGWGTYQAQPVWMLRLEAKYPQFQMDGEALNELCARLMAGKLTGKQVSLLVDDAIEAIDDPNTEWKDCGRNANWGNIFAEAAGLNFTNQKQQDAYLKAVVSHAKITIAKHVLEDGQIGLQIDSHDAKIGVQNSFNPMRGSLGGKMPKCRIQFRFTDGVFRIGNMQMKYRECSSSIGHFYNGDTRFLSNFARQGMVVKPGDYEVEWEPTIECLVYKGRLMSKQSFKLHGKLEVVEREKGLGMIELIRSEEEKKAFIDAIDEVYIRVEPQRSEWEIKDETQSVMVDLMLNKVPMNVAYEILMRDLNREWKEHCDLVHAKAKHGWGIGMDRNVDLEVMKGKKKVDLLLRPSKVRAWNIDGMREILGEEILLKDVEVRWE